MRLVLQDLGNGETRVADAPYPICLPGHVLIKTSVSLISTGTERMLVDFSRSSLLSKARQQPEKVRAVLDKMSTDGVGATLVAVRSKLREPITMGYSNVGVVVESGKGVEDLFKGDRVVSNGRHAEVVCVPRNLCAAVPDTVPNDMAVFTVVGSIALQGIRLLRPQIGDFVVVIGLGLVGLLSVQLLRAQGCKVLGIDFGSEKLEAASGMGAAVCNLAEGADPVAKALAWSRGRGVDGVLIAASTKSSDPVSHAAKMSRKRGKIVLVGSTGLELSRSDFYEKELSFQVSCSYGPGRYDSSYELKGIDYPIGFVRWTEQRNFEAVLDMMADGKIDTASMLTDRFDISNAADAYERLASDKSVLALLLDYPSDQSSLVPVISLAPPAAQVSVPQSVAIGCIGSGNYAGRVLLPAAAKTGARLKTLSSAGGVSAAVVGRQLGFEQCSSEAAVIFDDADINAVLVATRHDTHATYVVEALNRGKNVFVEKPLGLDTVDLERIESAYIEARRQFNPPRLMVGFNRRFSPLAVRLKSLLSSLDERMAIVYTCNAGAIPADHWTQDPEIGGGRIIGEACHFVDFVRYLAASPIKSVSAIGMRPTSQANDTRDVASISVDFVDGSIASINYLANGHPSIPKERIEVYQAGRVFALNNFRSLIGNGVRGFRSMKLRKQNKGQLECIAAFVDAIKRGIPSPIDFDELIEVSKFAIEAAACLSKRDSKRESA